MDGSFCRLTNAAHLLIGGFVTNMRSRGGAASMRSSSVAILSQRIVKRQVVAGVARVPEVTQEALHMCKSPRPRLLLRSAPVKRMDVLAPAEGF